MVLVALLLLASWTGVGRSQLRTLDGALMPHLPTNGSSYAWLPEPWSGCVYRDHSALLGASSSRCCACHRRRQVHCVLLPSASDGHVIADVTRTMRESDPGDLDIPLKRIAPFYCRKLSVPRPTDTQPCELCQQDCVLSMWGEWSVCSDTCSPASRFRTRSVLLLPSGGGAECGPLLDLESCTHLPRCQHGGPLRPELKYSWVVGDWTGCRKNTSRLVRSQGSQEVGYSVEVECGPGFTWREVACRDKHGRQVADQFCLQYIPGQEKPLHMRMCHIPCSCLVGPWSPWSSCSHTCQTHVPDRLQELILLGVLAVGFETRSRAVIQPEEEGGVGCPPLSETRACQTEPNCPRFTWHIGGWGECQAPDGASCTSGSQSRHVACVEAGRESVEVPDQYCLAELLLEDPTQRLRPASERACSTPCPVPCQLGEWAPWSPCSQSCGTGGMQVRNRPVLQEPSDEGEVCEPETESRECNNTPCKMWNIGPWSTCFLPDYRALCGLGHRLRNVYCESAVAEVLQDSACAEPKPEIEVDCRVHCEDDCTVGEWSDWSACSKSCGREGGVQTRTRQILENFGPSPCLNASDLNESQPCNRRECVVRQWHTGAWEIGCQLSDNSTAMCGQQGSGVQSRAVYCVNHRAERIRDESCLSVSPKPAESRSCTPLCPENCELRPWGTWSECDVPCGQSKRYRARQVTSLAQNGNTPCSGADDNGVIVDSEPCVLPPCEGWTRNTTDWGVCRAADRRAQCGHGVRMRAVYCARSDGVLATNDQCLERVTGVAPLSQEPCYLPCQADCALSEWGQWGDCSETCGQHGGLRTRTRHLIHALSGVTLDEQCPDIRPRDLVEEVTCVGKPCHVFDWDLGDWTDCIALNVTSACGPGIMRRHVFCRSLRGDLYTLTEVCARSASVRENFQACQIPCPVDCQVVEWSVWGPCSQPCGMGVRSRQRRVESESLDGGAECPELQQNRTCEHRPCEDFIWSTGKWSDCRPSNNQACGRGLVSRDVTCPAGGHLVHECEVRQQKPPSSDVCYKPCPADCVMGEWSAWSQCDCASQTRPPRTRRHRQVLRQPAQQGRQCESLEEWRHCQCDLYTLLVGEWMSCVAASNEECGDGIEERTVQCVLSPGGLPVPLSFCPGTPVSSAQPCTKPCPRHCELSDFTAWSTCSSSCGSSALKIRERRIERRPNRHGGRQCPERDALQQITTCEAEACFAYTWQAREWTQCTVDTRIQCGVGSQTRKTSCVRGDGQEVERQFCRHLTDEEPEPRLEAPCGEPCPGDCVLSPWSEWGACYTDCKDSMQRGKQVRSRTVVAPSESGAPCPDQWVEKRDCEPASCPVFLWHVREWDYSDRRRVYCRPENEDVRVSGGCVEEEKPARSLECSPKCGIYANCLEGACVCQSGFHGDGYQCLPEYGCHDNMHCIATNSFCDTSIKECVCADGTLPRHDLVCVAPPPVPTSQSATAPPNNLLLFILIGCLVLIFALAVIAAACFIRHLSGKRTKETPNKNASSDTIGNSGTVKNNEAIPKVSSETRKGPSGPRSPPEGAYSKHLLHPAPATDSVYNKQLMNPVPPGESYYYKPEKYRTPHIESPYNKYLLNPNPRTDIPSNQHSLNVTPTNFLPHSSAENSYPRHLLNPSPISSSCSKPKSNVPYETEENGTDEPRDVRPKSRSNHDGPSSPHKTPYTGHSGRELTLPYITIPSRNTATPSPLELQLKSFKPLPGSIRNRAPGDMYRGESEREEYDNERPISRSPYHRERPVLSNEYDGRGNDYSDNTGVPADYNNIHPAPYLTSSPVLAKALPSFPRVEMSVRQHSGDMPRLGDQHVTGHNVLPMSNKYQPNTEEDNGYPASPKPYPQLGKYSSLPRHGTSALKHPEKLYNPSEPNPQDPQTYYNAKYGSLPTKSRREASRKKDAAQNLIEYCDALLADLEQAASTTPP